MANPVVPLMGDYEGIFQVFTESLRRKEDLLLSRRRE